MNKIFKDTIDYLSSVRLTAVILIAVAVLAAIGTLVGQNSLPEEYVMRFGHTAYRVLSLLSVTDIYHSVYFNALLMLLVVNITLCTLSFAPKRITALWKKPAKESSYPLSESLVSSRAEDEVLGGVVKSVRRPLCRTTVTSRGAETVVVSAPHPVFSLGAIIVHISILMIIIGGLISSLFGFSGDMIIIEGGISREVILDRKHLVMLDFSVELNRFTFDRYADGTPREYRSDITIIDGENRTGASLTVNHPAKHNGVRFYQTSFGREMDYATIEILNREGKSIFTGDAYWSIPITVPGRDMTFTIVRNSPEFMDLGPAVQLLITDGKEQYDLWSFVNYPDFDRERDGDLVFLLKNYHEVPYSGITAVKEPGLGLVFAGFILICIGFLFPIASSMGRFSVRVSPGAKTTEIIVQGAPGKLKVGFDALFKRLVDGIRKSLC
jgi:cytochrome c biogenesis protein